MKPRKTDFLKIRITKQDMRTLKREADAVQRPLAQYVRLRLGLRP